MKYLKQFLIIVAVSFLGEVLHVLLPLPVPASIYGLILMFIALTTNIIPLHAVKDTAKFLIEIMPVMFIPAAVGLLGTWNQLAPVLVPIVVIMLVSTVIVMAVSGKVTQFVINTEKKNKRGKK